MAAAHAFDSSTFEPSTRTIRKRDGSTVQPFDVGKIKRAVAAAWTAEEVKKTFSEDALTRVVDAALAVVPDGEVTVEQMQDIVEVALMRCGYYAVAKHYILYREEHTEKRKLRDRKPDPRAVSDYIHAGKYARYRGDLQRREVYARRSTG